MARTTSVCVLVLVYVLFFVNLDVLCDTFISEHQHVHCKHEHPKADQVSTSKRPNLFCFFKF